ncbi:sensor histidine kinase [Bifidobacterium oedipodis]|nr:histidine kinase [Bifidobacterium sp. DSM 109957]
MAASIAVLEVVFHAISSPLNGSDTLLLAMLCTLLAAAPWLGNIGDFLYAGAFAAVGILHYGFSLTFPVLGVFLIAAVWIVRHQAIRAVLLLAGYVLLMFWQTDAGLYRLASDTLLMVVVLTVGFAFRKFMDEAEQSRQDLEKTKEESAKAAEAIRAKLAMGLHDTIARDLARISISLESLAAAHPDLTDEITPIVGLVHNSSRRLRPVIMELSADAPTPSLNNAIAESKLMLQSRQLDLVAHMPEDIDQLLSRQAILTGSLFAREAATNALKYAQQETSVDLFVEVGDGELSLMMTNAIAEKPSKNALTGGFGLGNLKSRIESEGGRLSFVSNSGHWIVNAVIPNQRETGGSNE